jgi:guanyl-specific ribonuclease Sa
MTRFEASSGRHTQRNKDFFRRYSCSAPGDNSPRGATKILRTGMKPM